MTEVSGYYRLDDSTVMMKVKWTHTASDQFIVVFVKVRADTLDIDTKMQTIPRHIQMIAIDQARELVKEFTNATENDIP